MEYDVILFNLNVMINILHISLKKCIHDKYYHHPTIFIHLFYNQ